MSTIVDDLESYVSKRGLSKTETIGFVGFGEIQLASICVKLAKEKGTKSLLGSKRICQLDPAEYITGPVSQSSIIKNPKVQKTNKQFDIKIELTWTEVLSIAFVAHFHNQTLDNNIKALIGVQVDKNYTPQSELMLSDGVLLFYNEGNFEYSFIYQQVMAQNLYGENLNKDLNQEIIRLIDKKAERRNTYAEGCGLIVTVITNGGDIDIRKIIEASNADAFYPSFLVLYQNNFEDVTIHVINTKVLEGENGIELTTKKQKFRKLPEKV